MMRVKIESVHKKTQELVRNSTVKLKRYNPPQRSLAEFLSEDIDSIENKGGFRGFGTRLRDWKKKKEAENELLTNECKNKADEQPAVHAGDDNMVQCLLDELVNEISSLVDKELACLSKNALPLPQETEELKERELNTQDMCLHLESASFDSVDFLDNLAERGVQNLNSCHAPIQKSENEQLSSSAPSVNTKKVFRQKRISNVNVSLLGGTPKLGGNDSILSSPFIDLCDDLSTEAVTPSDNLLMRALKHNPRKSVRSSSSPQKAQISMITQEHSGLSRDEMLVTTESVSPKPTKHDSGRGLALLKSRLAKGIAARRDEGIKRRTLLWKQELGEDVSDNEEILSDKEKSSLKKDILEDDNDSEEDEEVEDSSSDDEEEEDEESDEILDEEEDALEKRKPKNEFIEEEAEVDEAEEENGNELVDEQEALNEADDESSDNEEETDTNKEHALASKSHKVDYTSTHELTETHPEDAPKHCDNPSEDSPSEDTMNLTLYLEDSCDPNDNALEDSQPGVNADEYDECASMAEGSQKADDDIFARITLPFATSQDGRQSQDVGNNSSKTELEKLLGTQAAKESDQLPQTQDLMELCSQGFDSQERDKIDVPGHQSIDPTEHDKTAEHVATREETLRFNENLKKHTSEELFQSESDDDDFEEPQHLQAAEAKMEVSGAKNQGSASDNESDDDIIPNENKNDDSADSSDDELAQFQKMNTITDFFASERKEKKFKGFRNTEGVMKRKFVEEEAELSGSEIDHDELYDLDDEDDEYEIEEGDLENLPSERKLKEQLDRIHRKLEDGEDKRNLLNMMDTYLEDGDLHSGPRRLKRFKWREGDEDDDESEEMWKWCMGEGREGDEENVGELPDVTALSTLAERDVVERDILIRKTPLDLDDEREYSPDEPSSSLDEEPSEQGQSQQETSVMQMVKVPDMFKLDKETGPSKLDDDLAEPNISILRGRKRHRDSLLGRSEDDRRKLAKIASLADSISCLDNQNLSNCVYRRNASDKKSQRPQTKSISTGLKRKLLTDHTDSLLDLL